MKNIFVLLASCTAGLIFVSDTRALDFKGRDLDRYDLDGPYSLDRSSRHVEDRPVIEAALREFLWTRWNKHRLAHVSVVQYSLEGFATREWYFVEPDPHGVWRIVVERDITLPGIKPEAPGEHIRESHRYEIYFVDRVPNGEKSNSSAPLPDDDQRPAAEYKLRLRDSKGEVILQL
jgi:hypothetical protein